MATLRHGPRTASPLLDPLWAALLGLVAGVAIGGQWFPYLHALQALLGSALP
ncbi:MAG: hypothetical protein JSR54_15045 [Proteobacteria bacterium]|nr:hypothetical protein [Pseudomonadota bacterium]